MDGGFCFSLGRDKPAGAQRETETVTKTKATAHHNSRTEAEAANNASAGNIGGLLKAVRIFSIQQGV